MNDIKNCESGTTLFATFLPFQSPTLSIKNLFFFFKKIFFTFSMKVILFGGFCNQQISNGSTKLIYNYKSIQFCLIYSKIQTVNSFSSFEQFIVILSNQRTLHTTVKLNYGLPSTALLS